MFKINTRALVYTNPTCEAPIGEHRLYTHSADYFDKDGFELTQLERDYYQASNYPLDNDTLNHCCFDEPWLVLSKTAPQGFLVDHCILLHRCDFTGAAREQLLRHKHMRPKLSYLLNCKQKWGLDLALDYFDGENMYEVLHIEQDFHTSEECTAYKENIEKFVLATDWEDAAKRLIVKKDEWSSLIGFAQNDWKARFFGFPKAELTHKAIVY
jgi:hypothetical protein